MLPNIQDNVVFEGYSLAVFPRRQIEGEIGRLMSRCATAPSKTTALGSDEEWEGVMNDLLDLLPEKSEIGVDLELPQKSRKQIALQCERLLHAIEREETFHGRDFDPTQWILAPRYYRERVEFLLGSAQIPFAWIAINDALVGARR